MKKLLISLLCLLFVVCLCGCAPATEYDSLEVSKIESTWRENMAPSYSRGFQRTFDFQTGTVTDIWLADFDGALQEELDSVDMGRYNTPQQVTTFSAEAGQQLL